MTDDPDIYYVWVFNPTTQVWIVRDHAYEEMLGRQLFMTRISANRHSRVRLVHDGATLAEWGAPLNG